MPRRDRVERRVVLELDDHLARDDLVLGGRLREGRRDGDRAGCIRLNGDIGAGSDRERGRRREGSGQPPGERTTGHRRDPPEERKHAHSDEGTETALGAHPTSIATERGPDVAI
jgi:hypothetical protein